MNYVLDVSKWRCGGDQQRQNCSTGEGDTALCNKQGFMCCLGQFAEQQGVSKRLMLGIGEPGTLFGQLAGAKKKRQYDPLFVTECGADTDLAGELMKINDDESTTISTKIKQIRRELEARGHSLEVINQLPANDYYPDQLTTFSRYPVVQQPDGWYYYDETWDDINLIGPYSSEAEATFALGKYCGSINAQSMM